MAYTFEQLQQMGAKPVGQPTSSPVSQTSGKKKYTLNELKTLGAKPVATSITKPEEPKKSISEKVSGVLDTVFGGKKIGEAIGTKIAEMRATPAERQFIEKGPTTKEVLGDVGRVALNFAPVGTASKVATKVAKPLLGSLAKPVANIATGAAVGATGQALTNISEGEKAKFGTGGLVGAGITALPYVGKGLARLGGEALGATTGTGYGTLKAAYQASKAGGEKAEVLRKALRGKIPSENIVEDARGALSNIIDNRRTDYQTQLSKLKSSTKLFNPKPVVSAYNKQLEDFGVFFDKKGVPDFSRAPGLDRHKKDLIKLGQTIANWGKRPGDNTLVGIDKLKQTIDDFRIGSVDAKRFDSFVTNLRNKAQDIIKKEPGYNKLVKNYAESTGLITDIQKGLSMGDKILVDNSFSKLTTALRTNNEFRKKLVEELNKETGGKLIPEIAGQQLSEILPRGLIRPLGAIGGTASLATGGIGILPLLQLAIFTSPRVVGELVNALGFVGNKGKLLTDAITKMGGKIQAPGDTLLEKIKGQKTSKGNKGIAKIGALMAGAGLATSAAAPGIASRLTSTTYKSSPEQPPMEVPQEKLSKALLQLESSGGTNKANADPGEMMWLTGLTNIAIKELRRLGLLRKDFNKNNPDHVIEESIKLFNHYQKKFPNKTPAEIYVDHYWTQATSSAQRQKKMDEFNQLINS